MTTVSDIFLRAGSAAAPGTQPLSLRQNFSWTLVGTTAYSACNWAMLAVLAKLGTPEMVGRFTLALAICQPIMVFAQLHLRTVQATDAAGEFAFEDYVGLRLLTTLAAWLIIAGTGLLSGFDAHTGFVVLAIGTGIAFDAISDVLYGHLQRHERMDRIAISMMLKGVLSLIGLTGGILFTGGVLGAAIGSALASALVLAVYDLPNSVRILGSVGRRAGRLEVIRRWDAHRLASLLWLALPMGVVTMLNALNANVSRYFIALYLGEHQLGIFAASASLIGAGRTIVSALGQAAYPRLAQHYAADQYEQFRRVLLRLVGIATLVGVGGFAGGLAAGREILTLLFRAEYAERVDVLHWLLAAGALVYLGNSLGIGLTAARFFRVQVPMALFGIGASIVSSWLLIPPAGLRGAAIAAVVAAGLGVAAVFLILLRALRTGGRAQ